MKTAGKPRIASQTAFVIPSVARNLLFALAFLFLCVNPASAQVATGTPPFGSFSGGPDVINLGDNNAHLCLPVLNKPGRGTSFSYDLCYDPSIWAPVASGSTATWTPNSNFGFGSNSAIASGNTGYITYIFATFVCYDGSTNGYPTGGGNFTGMLVYVDPWGVGHSFPGYNQTASGSCTSHYSTIDTFTFPETTPDGSGYTIKATSGPVIKRDGTTISPPINPTGGAYATTIIDSNGNQTNSDSSGHFYDTMSSTSPVLTASGSGTTASPTKFTYTAPSGASATFTMSYVYYTVATNFAVSGISEKGATAAYLVDKVTLPDGSFYQFTYEATPSTPTNHACTPLSGTYQTNCVTARVTKITLPTGGYIAYAYSGGDGTNGSGIFSDGSAAVLQRTVYDGANTNTWTYTRSLVSGSNWQTKMTDPLGNDLVINFQKVTIPNPNNPPIYNFYETQRTAYQGAQSSNNVLQTTNTCYNGAASPCTATNVTFPITQKSAVTALPGAANLQARALSTYDPSGRLVEVDEYDFGSGAPPATPTRKTIKTYSVFPPGVTLLTSAAVQDGSGNVKAQTTYAYDETSVVAPTQTSPQHTSVTGPRGNATTIKRYKDATNFLTTTATYFDTGLVQTATDANGAQNTFAYPDATSTCGNSFATSVNEPLSLSKSMTWNCTGGVQLTSVDENTKTTTTAYTDAYFWRPASVTDPTTAVANMTYNGATSVESALSINSSSKVDTLTTVDGLGRNRLSQSRQAPGSANFDTLEQDYDNLGRPSRGTLPYTGTSGQTNSTAPATSTTYDALSRPLTVTVAGGGTVTYSYNQNDILVTVGPAPTGEHAKSRQLEYDGLGRLTSVCEITSGAGSGTCGQTVSQTGFWTKYSYDLNNNLISVTQNAQAAAGSQQTRSYAYDFLSRLTSETNPENGTTTYSYDSASGCTGTYNGDLVKKVDAVGNVTCLAYDALHRKLSATYPSGTYASVTPSKYFVYDSATVNGTAMNNVRGRLAEAYTCSSCPGTNLTDIGYSYTVRGEFSDVYQSTPHSNGYYHLTQSYWAHGSPNALSGLPGLPTITYGGTIGSTVGLDGEGRITQVTAGSGQNPITGVTYNNASLPTQVNFGSGDNDIFAYDSNTMRMTQFKFNVGTQAKYLNGALTWNANSSLSQLAITDQYNSSDTQTCNYTHDDLARIATANCGTAANQSFSYDAFGNISKSGSPYSFQPTYTTNPPTNRFATIPGTTPSYDANGNVLSDGSHTYAWDSDGNSITVDSVGLTYDAVDRMVEQNRSGTYTQIVYGPGGGKLALMNGSSLTKAFVPLPGQATAVYTSSGLDHYRHSDWLGSARLTSSPTQSTEFLSSVAYAPFGETYASSGTTDVSFTGMNSDTVSSDYDFLYRPYSTQGRWPTPDPSGLAAVNPPNPQSWNRYAYVLNNPLLAVDPYGLKCLTVTWVDEYGRNQQGSPTITTERAARRQGSQQTVQTVNKGLRRPIK